MSAIDSSRVHQLWVSQDYRKPGDFSRSPFLPEPSADSSCGLATDSAARNCWQAKRTSCDAESAGFLGGSGKPRFLGRLGFRGAVTRQVARLEILRPVNGTRWTNLST